VKQVLLLGGALSGALLLGLFGANAQPAYDGAHAMSVFNDRCKDCHDPAIDRAPSRQDLAQRTPENIVDVLTKGAMAPMAAGLSPAEINGLAVYLSGKPLAQAAPPAARPGAAPAAGPQAAAGRGPAAPAGVQPADVMCASNPAIHASASDWNGFNKDLAATRRQPTTSINANNVERLKVKWSFSIAGGRTGQPAVIGDHLFLTTGNGDAFSLDAKTGCVHWRAKLNTARAAPVVEHRGKTWVVYVGTRDRNIVALDAQTGKELWRTTVETHPRSNLTGGLAIYNGHLYVPTSSSEETIATIPDYSCCTFTGAVTSIDTKTGKVEWKTPMVETPRPTRKNSAGTQMYGPAGGAIWSQPTLDPKRHAIYVATGDSYTEVDTQGADAIVALDMASGKIKWLTQVTKADNFLTACAPGRRGLNCPLGETGPDYDFGTSPILVTLPSGKQVLNAGQKSGVAYGIDPDTGKPLWSVKLGAGSALGGIEWGMAADSHALYVPMSDVVAREGAKPGLTALDPATGKILWNNPAPKVPCSFVAARCSNAHSAPPVVIPGVIFAGSMDGWLRAYSTSTGRTLWMDNTAGRTYSTTNGVANQPGGSIDGTGPLVAGGMLYVVSGYTGATGAFGNPLNVVLAYSVDGK
jgi:polyvinyl alcohol dehydrogenase (cytochrome)